MKALLATLSPVYSYGSLPNLNPVLFLYLKYLEFQNFAVDLITKIQRETRPNVSKIADLEKNAFVEDGIKSKNLESEEPIVDMVGSGYPSDEDPGDKKKIKGKKSKKKRIIGGVVGGGAVVGLIVAGAGFLPAFVSGQMMSKLTGAFMDRANYALDQRVEKIANKYVISVIRPSLQTCKTAVSKDCNNFTPGQGVASRLYTSWRDNRIEEKLFNKHGISFELNTLNENEINVFRTNNQGIKRLEGTYGKHRVTKEVSSLIKAETKFKGVRDRRHVKSILSTKYRASKWCLIACKKRDELGDIKLSAIKRLKLKIVLRTVEPVSSKLATLMLCTIDGCSPQQLEERTTKVAAELADKLDSDYLTETAEKLNARGNPSLGQYLARDAIEKIMLKAGVSVATTTSVLSAIPVAGQIYLGLTIIDFLDRVDEKLENKEYSKYIRGVNEEASAAYAASQLTLADEAHSGQASLEDSGALFSMISSFNKSRLSQAISDEPVTNTVVCQDVTLSSPTDPLVCPEKKLQPTLGLEELRNDPTLSTLFDFSDIYGRCIGLNPLGQCVGIIPRDIIRPTLGFIDLAGSTITGALLEGAKSLVSTLGGGSFIDSVEEWFEEKAAEGLTAITKRIFPIQLNGDAEDGEMFDQTAVGMDVIGNNFAKGTAAPDGSFVGLGGAQLDSGQQVELQIAINKSRNEELKNQSIFERYFDINNYDSLAASSLENFATLVPLNGNPIVLSNGISGIFNGLSSILGQNKKASAVALNFDRGSLFGVTQYGFSVNDPALSIDPDELTPQKCQEFALAREASKYLDEETGETQYRLSNPCYLEEVAVDSLTKIYDLDDENAVLTSPDSPTPEYEQGESTDNVPCATGTTVVDERIFALDGGKEVYIKTCNAEGVTVSSVISEQVRRLIIDARSAGFNFGGTGFRSHQRQIELRTINGCPDIWFASASECRVPTAIPGRSRHEIGLAIDFTYNGTLIRGHSNPGFVWLDQHASEYGLSNLPSEPWHWSRGGN